MKLADKTSFYSHRLTRIALAGAVLVFSFLFVISFALPKLDPFMAILLVGIVFLGIPHGALDIFLLRKLSNQPGLLRANIGLYLFGVAVIAISWAYVPEGAFLFFIAFSCFHFAYSDLSRRPPEEGPAGFPYLEFGARFLIPFFVPFGIHPERSIQLAGFVHRATIFESLLPAIIVLTWVALALSALLALFEIIGAVAYRKEWRIVSLEPLVIFLLFYFLDPLYSFVLYFCFIHSVKHIVNFLSSSIEVKITALLPYCLIPAATIFLLAWATASSRMSVDERFFKWSIILISSMAFPHTLLIYLAKKRRLIY